MIMMTGSRTLRMVLAGVLLASFVQAEIREIDLVLPPTQASIRYTEGYIRAPGWIDLSPLTFSTVAENFDDDVVRNRRHLDGGIEAGSFNVDIAIFRLPESCAGSNGGCDWTELGIGARTDGGALRYCCSADAIDFGLCTEDHTGQLIVQSMFAGKHRYISIPPEGDVTKHLKYGRFDLDDDQSDGFDDGTGKYIVVFANCNDEGRPVKVEGDTVWKSVNGYLPGELYGFMYFYGLIAVIYLALLLFFGISMQVYKESRIAIEKWIFLTIALGLGALSFRTADYVYWNIVGHRPMLLVYLGILLEVLKQGLSRTLIVMVSLGWGVVRDSLGGTLRTVIILGAIYIGVSAALDLLDLFYIEDIKMLTPGEVEDIFDVVWLLTIASAAVDVIYILWILDALNGTMQYLENMSQSRKLQRFLQLRSLLLFAILAACIWMVFTLVDKYDEDGIVQEEHQWVVDAAIEVIYLYLLIGVAFLWRPNPAAQEYAYVMELRSDGEDVDENDLELTGVVPSAMDDDDDFDDEPKMNEQGGTDGRFQIA
jgi:hypothetical protein